jgi:outer membrane protein OmpA-like peptidoglycan-associated protein
MRWGSEIVSEVIVKSPRFLFAIVLTLCLVPFCSSQDSNSSQVSQPSAQSTPSNNNSDQNSQTSAQANPLKMVARSVKAIDYRQGSKSEINFKGTDLMPQATGKAEVATKTGASQVEAKLELLEPANSLGLQYLTYVLWAISPEGVPSNLGELVVKDGKAAIHTSAPIQAFALIVTAEPYFAVTQPSDKVVAQNEPGPKVEGFLRSIDVTYQAIPGDIYLSQVKPMDEPVYGIDKKVPLSLKEARNAVRIAKAAHADQYAPSALQRAQQLLSQADDYYNRKQNEKAIATVAREATQAAEAARVTSIQAEQQAKIDEEKRVAEEKTAKAQAEAEAQTHQAQQAQEQAQQQAQQAQQAEAARRDAEQQASQAQAAAQQAAAAAQAAQQQLQQEQTSGQQVQADQQAAAQQAQAQADQARQQAAAAQQHAQDVERQAQQAEQLLQQQQTAAQQAQQQLQQEQAARQQAEQQNQASQQQLEQTQQQLQQAQTEKEQVRQKLLEQLNQVLQTKDSARGLIVNMPDVLFDLNSANLKPTARERLAKVAGILIAYPDIHVEVDGYTDNTGAADYNQQLSQQRADTVRNYLVQQGVPASSIEAKGFGESDPIASNDSPEGRRQNRRVDLVVSGESIGAQMMAPTSSTH